MKKNKLLTTAVALSVLATAGIATVPVHALGATAPVNVSIEAPVFDVVLPTEYSFAAREDGIAGGTEGVYVTNNSSGLVDVTDVSITLAEGWKLKTLDEMEEVAFDIAADAKIMAFEIAGCDIVHAPEDKTELLTWLSNIKVGASKSANGYAVFPVHSTTTTTAEQAATVTFVVDWSR